MMTSYLLAPSNAETVNYLGLVVHRIPTGVKYHCASFKLLKFFNFKYSVASLWVYCSAPVQLHVQFENLRQIIQNNIQLIDLGYTILLHVAVPNCFWTHKGLWHQYKGKERVITKALSNLILQRLVKNLGFTFFYFFVDFSIYHFVSFITEKWKTILFFLHLYKVECKINISTSAFLNLKYYSLPNKKVTFLCKLIWSIVLFAFKILYFVCIKF